MSETKVNLTDNQIEFALTLYAQGKTSAQVIDELLFDFPDLDDTPENRSMLREQLRSVNPNDKRFSHSKYGMRFDMVHLAVVEELKQQSHNAMREVVASLGRGTEKLDDLASVLSSILDNASDNDITSNTEYLNTVRTLVSLQKVKIEGVNALSTLVEQLCKLHALKTTSTEDSD